MNGHRGDDGVITGHIDYEVDDQGSQGTLELI